MNKKPIKILEYNKTKYLDYPIAANYSDNIGCVNELIDNFLDLVKLDDIKNINIICRGSSGLIIATMFAVRLTGFDVKIVYIRKESNHHSQIYQDLKPLNRLNAHNIIVDDFINTGETIREIKKHLDDNEYHPVIDGIVVTNLRCSTGDLGIKPKYLLTCK